MVASLPNELIVAEPAGQYVTRSPLVADCSVVAAYAFDEPEGELAKDIMSGHELIVPSLIDYEMANVAVMKSRQGLDEVTHQGLIEYAELDLIRHEVDPIEQWQLAMRYTLTAYDAAYLWLAGALGAPLATFDQKLGRAAKRYLSDSL